MKKRIASVCLGLLLLILTVAGASGCSKKYEKIELTKSSEELAGQGRTDGAGADGSGQPDTGLADSGQAGVWQTDAGQAESQTQGAAEDPTADASTLDNELTRDSGFTDTDETVYILSDLVNVRTGCGTEFGVLTQLNKGDQLKRTGYSESWSRVICQDKVGYVQTKYVSAEPGQEKTDDAGNQAAQARQDGDSAGAEPAAADTVSNGRIVAIDAAHQAKGDSGKEPIGPGSSTKKPKATTGTVGVVSKLPESELTLKISKKVKRILEERGYQVVMTRESNDVNLSNADRAEIANKSGASVYVRIQANSLDNSKVRGTVSMCQTGKNPYNGDLHDQSYSLSRKITDAVCAATGFKNRGVQETDTMSGINWSTIPVSIVEVGFMSNPEEDALMAQDEWQEKIAAGIADGIDAYFAGQMP